jgi:hypothetical protein
VRRVLDDPVAIYTWLLVTLAGVVAMLVVGQVPAQPDPSGTDAVPTAGVRPAARRPT